MANVLPLEICVDDNPTSASSWWSLEQMYTTYTTRNELTYAKSPQRSLDMTLHNAENAFYVPTVTFTFNYISLQEYQKLLQLINSKGFFVRYYDFELGEKVQRRMYASSNSISDLYHNSVNLVALLGMQLTFVSIFGYEYLKSPKEGGDPLLWNDTNKYHYYYLHSNANEERIQDK